MKLLTCVSSVVFFCLEGRLTLFGYRWFERLLHVKTDYLKDRDVGQGDARRKMPKPKGLAVTQEPEKCMQQRSHRCATIHQPEITAQFSFARDVLCSVMHPERPPIQIAPHPGSIFFEKAFEVGEMM